MWSLSSLLLPLLLSLVLSVNAQAPPPASPTVYLLLNDFPAHFKDPRAIFLYPLTLSSNQSLTLTINASDTAAILVYNCTGYDYEATTFDLITALPTPGTPNSVLIAHEAYGYNQYNRIILPSPFTSNRSTPYVHLGDSQPNPTDYFPGVGDWPLWIHYLFHMDVMNAYYTVSFVNGIDQGKTITFHMYIWKSPESITQPANVPILQWQTTLPYDSNAFGLVGGVAALDQDRGLAFLTLAFWQSTMPEFNCGYLLTFHAQDNLIMHNVTYPKNVTGFFDWAVTLQWSTRRQGLFSVIFEESIHLEQVDPATGNSRQIAFFKIPPVFFDIYENTNVLDDATGNWWFLNVDEDETAPTGLPNILWYFNIDSGELSPVHHLLLPYTGLGILLPPKVQSSDEEPVAADVEEEEEDNITEYERLSLMRKNKRMANSVSVLTSVASD